MFDMSDLHQNVLRGLLDDISFLEVCQDISIDRLSARTLVDMEGFD